MRLYAALAWRNLWRNRRRSLISMASVVFAVVLALATRSMQLGFYAHTIDNVVSFYTGYLQIHDRGFEEHQDLEHSFPRPDSVGALAARAPGVTFTAPRLESFALLSSGRATDGARIAGIDPAREDRLTHLRRKVAAGRYLEPDDSGILLGSGLAAHLGVAAGDTIVALGSGYHAASAAARFRVVGTLTFPTPELNSRVAYLALPTAQRFLAAPDRVTSLAVMLTGADALPGAEARLRAALGSRFEVISWKTMMPEMVQYIELDNAGGIIMLCLVYVVIAFGILGTILMMTLERTREFGMLIAVGMRRRVLGAVVLLESVILALNGTVIGVLLGAPLVAGLARHPILLSGATAEAMRRYGFEPVLPFALRPSIFAWQALATLVIAIVAAAIPLSRIRRINPITAMREGR